MQDLTKTVDERIFSVFRYDQTMVAKFIDLAGDLAVNLVVATLILIVIVGFVAVLQQLGVQTSTRRPNCRP